jgi:hypothetical protein
MRTRITVTPTMAGRSAQRWWHKDGDRAGSRLSRVADVGPRLRHNDEAGAWGHLLDQYLEGWAEANLSKIFAATAHGYCFDDPQVGRFSRWSLPTYFERLQKRFSCVGGATGRDLAFFMHGPMDGPARLGRLTFFREAPALGLTGVTVITIGARGVIAEAVAYDLNPALDVLRGRSEKPE